MVLSSHVCNAKTFGDDEVRPNAKKMHVSKIQPKCTWTRRRPKPFAFFPVNVSVRRENVLPVLEAYVLLFV